MVGSNPDLFTFIMEADDDIPIPDFDAGDTPDEGGGEEPAAQEAPLTNNETGSDTLPPDLGNENDDFNFDPNAGGEEGNESADEGSGEDTTADQDDSARSVGEKANAILNEKLYRVLTERNAEIESHIKQIQQVLSVLPYEVVEDIDKPINQLKTALSKGQSYAIDKFVSAEYGTNLTFYEKLNALYILLEDEIDKRIKKVTKQ